MSCVAVIGGGLMGVGIAQVFAACGHSVRVYEPVESLRRSVRLRAGDNLHAIGLNAAAAALIETPPDLCSTVEGAHYVTEAAPEKLELKREIFAQLVAHAPRTAILASNSSVIPITRIAAGLETAERMVGTHWWNPAPLIPLVEVIQGEQTDDATIATTLRVLREIGKRPAHVKKDIPGFVANRLQHALWREAIAMVAAGVCDAATLDECVKSSFGLRLSVLGPLENADLVGLDLTLDIHRTIIPELDRHAGPHEFLQAQVDAGRLGFKSGAGFRAWNDEEMKSLRERLTRHLLAAQVARR
ncbi:MAG TPA: 3-hydroxyacyl-CoA dehydrogenase NAD-binding domain-containing protein [Vicinamibacterales bacterium]|nr:3-hydroxyacyl-CoA dehydrogenase NAD-binding domain-containing protein [Vicinamibacterales bacterium]